MSAVNAAASARPRAGRARRRLPERLRPPITVLLGLVVLVALWHVAVEIFNIRPYLLPAPLDVGQALYRGLTAPLNSRVSLVFHLIITFRAAGLGLLVGGLLGVLAGVFAASSRVVDGFLSSYVFALQGLPKVAIAPLLMIWFGFGLTTKALLAAFLVFFPMFVNTYTGLTTVDRGYERLFTALRAGPLQTLMQLRLPGALVMIFAGLEIAVVQALLGAIVGEFVAAEAGMGILLKQYQAVSNTAAMFAALILLAMTGVVLNGIIRLLRGRLIYWAPERSQQSTLAPSE
ncbi:ABC transporter permease [Rhizomonospora bruguierae]|uniref:ABC transporter permease n=1 Tax=Rhizomonospora bruguierae TaxID=1581705 RepID=UPI001BCCB8C9|nr:ABC transporter permease [Micromonospora sp. NBRC 107566]